MRVKVIITDSRRPEGWTEVHTFEAAPSLRSATFHAEEMVRKFNQSLRPGEVPRNLNLVEAWPMTKEEAAKLADNWRDLHDAAEGEESAACYGAAERFRMQAADIEQTLRDNGFPDVGALLK